MADSAAFEPVRRNIAQTAAAIRTNERSAEARASRPRAAPGLLRPSQVPVADATTRPTGSPSPAVERAYRGPKPPRPGRASTGVAAIPARPSTVPPVPDLLRGSGQPLPAPVRQEMGARLGADFSQVRMHTDSAARASAAELGARAYTVGEHVVLGDRGEDKHVLAHELTHVIQQRHGPVAGTDHGSALKVSDPLDVHEKAAEAYAVRAMRVPPSEPSLAATGTGEPEVAASRQLADAARAAAAPAPVPVVQRMLDYENFTPDALGTKDGRTCHEFAQKVSEFVDEAHQDLLAGNLKGWKGPKLASFLNLLARDSPYALVHVGNVIEERVYARMEEEGMGIEWTKQFSESMGGASKPNIVINLPGKKDGLIDITSDRFHILAKAGAWLGESHVYVAEAYFPSVTNEQLEIIKANVEAGGADEDTVKEMMKEARAARSAKKRAQRLATKKARDLLEKYPSGAAFIREAFAGDKAAAARYLLEHGLKAKGVTRHGATKTKRGRRLSPELKAQRKKKAQQLKKALAAAESSEDFGEMSEGTDMDEE